MMASVSNFCRSSKIFKPYFGPKSFVSRPSASIEVRGGRHVFQDKCTWTHYYIHTTISDLSRKITAACLHKRLPKTCTTWLVGSRVRLQTWPKSRKMLERHASHVSQYHQYMYRRLRVVMLGIRESSFVRPSYGSWRSNYLDKCPDSRVKNFGS